MAYIEDSNDIPAFAGGARVEDHFALLKPRVMSLVVFTAIVGLLLAPGGIHPVLGFIAILSIAIGAGGSGALNMWYDSDIDAVMSRTRNRPIPSGRVERNDALAIGIIASVFSVMTLGLATNWVAAGLLAFTIFFYAVIYTAWLKRSTPQNIVIGGAAGSFPPMIGWAAVTGDITLPSIILFLIIFLWTPPHFWALALYKQSDYGAAGIPMMPNVAGERSTKLQILGYSLVLLAASCLVLAALTPLEIQLISHGLDVMVPASVTAQASGAGWVLGPVFAKFSVLSPSWLAIELPSAVIVVVLLAWWASGGRLFRVRRVPAWRSATGGVSGEDRYTAFGYANPARRVLASVLLTQSRVQHLEHIPSHARTEIDPQISEHPTARLGYTVDVVELVDRFGYRPLIKPVRALATAATRLQSGRLDAYLTYMLIALLALLAVVTAMS